MRIVILVMLSAACAVGVASAKDVRTLDHVTQQDVKVGGFWRSEYRKLSVRWLPHCIRQMEKGGRGEEMLNLRATAELNAGRTPSVKFKGCPWSDAYPYNTAESICLALEIDPGDDAEWKKANGRLRSTLEEWIPVFLAAQEPSGYIHSFHALRKLPHFSNAANHEFYVMGYFIELGVAHFRMTKGKDRRLFDAAIRCADHLDSVFGPAPKRTWLNGHPGLEYALCRLADAVNAADGQGKGDKYARLAQHFIRNQHKAVGSNAHWNSAYHQAERPAEEMSEATGHAVRACYFYTAMAALGNRLDDKPLAAASDRIFANAIDRKEYITGGVGANPHGEAFGPDWWLPLNGYCEACAACGMSFWCAEMRTAGRGPRVEDVRERLLYNLVVGSISNDGERFLYRNPPNGRERHYPWHGCPCCIGNIPRTLFALKDTMYAFARDGKTLFVDQFMDSESDVTLGGRQYHVKMATRYPDAGRVELTITPTPDFKVVVRYPDRAESPLYTAVPAVEHGYREVAPMGAGDSKHATARYSWTLPMPYQEVTADARVEACRGRKAYQRGPTVYSWEGPFGDTCVPFRDRLENGGFSAVWKGGGRLAGGFALHTWNATAEYKDIEVTAADGTVIWKGLPDPAACKKSKGGKWSVENGVIRQSNPNSSATELSFGGPEWRDCTVRFKARRTGGREGFVFHVRHETTGRTIMVNIGGWNNTQHAIEAVGYSCYAKEVVTCPGTLETGRWYDIEIVCKGDAVVVKMDGDTLFAPVSIPAGDFAVCAAPTPGTRTADSIHIRDPFVVVDQEKGCYCLLSSCFAPEGKRGNDGFAFLGTGAKMYESKDLVNWSEPKQVLTIPEWVGCKALWAPEVHRFRDKWYILGTVNSDGNRRGTWTFVSDSLRGPYRPTGRRPITPPEWLALDGTLWVEDGKPYMVFCHEWVQIGDGEMCYVQMNDDLSAPVGEPRTLFKATDYTPSPSKARCLDHVTDGPFLYRSPKSGKLFMTWSNIDANHQYLVILSESASGRLAGPWVRHKVIFGKDGGHGMIFRKLDGSLAFALHQPNSVRRERPKFFPVEDDGDTLRIVADASVTISRSKEWIPLSDTTDIVPGSALDFSKLGWIDAPAGKHGRVVAKGPHFEFEKMPGVPQRFYGCNLCFTANYLSDEDADALCSRLARMGYNALRIHHYESLLCDTKDDTTLVPEKMAQLDGLLNACIRHGIYLTTDLFVSRRVKWRTCGIDRDGYITMNEFKELALFDERVFRNYLEFSRNLLCHVNQKTGRRWADEPAFAFLALINEGNLGNHGYKFLASQETFMAKWREWLAARRAESPDLYRGITEDVPRNAWENSRQNCAFTLFLADLEASFAERMTKFVREDIGSKVLLTDMSCWRNPVAYQLVRTRYDYVDDHFYVDHPQFLEKKWQLPSKCPNENPVRRPSMGFEGVARHRLLDRPFTISEFNYSGPGQFRGVGGMMLGAQAALQDYDAIWRFAWSHSHDGVLESKPMTYFDVSRDPLQRATERAALALYMRRDMKPLERTFAVTIPEAKVRTTFDVGPHADVKDMWFGWFERFGTWIGSGKPKFATDGAEFPEAYSLKTDYFKSRTSDRQIGDGQVAISRDEGTFAVDTPRTQGFFAESGSHGAGALSARISGAPAAVWVSALDDAPVEKSARMLLTHVTDVQDEGMAYADGEKKVLKKWGKLPHLMRAGRADVALKLSDGAAPRVYALRADGSRRCEVPSSWDGKTLSFSADTARDASDATCLYEIVRM